MTTIHYLVRKEMGNVKATRIISAILRVFGVAAVVEYFGPTDFTKSYGKSVDAA